MRALLSHFLKIQKHKVYKVHGGTTGIMTFIIGVTAFFLSVAAIFLIRSGWERRQLCTEHYTIAGRMKKAKLRIAFFSDVHDRLTKKGLSEIAEAVRSEKPDAVVLGGDIFTYANYKSDPAVKELIFDFIKELSAICSVFYGEGNHEQMLGRRNPSEYEKYVSGCERSGASYITDNHIIFEDAAFYFASLCMKYYKKRFPSHKDKEEMPRDYLLKKLGLPQKDRMNILVMHSPMYLEEAADWGADLVLSGHFHGGTIRLPVLGGLMTPQFQFFVKECSGLHRIKDTQMIVTRGIGTHSVNIRLNDLPEVSIIDITD